MDKRTIRIISLVAVIGLSLLSFDFAVKPAYAVVSNTDIAVGDNNNSAFFIELEEKWITLPVGGIDTHGIISFISSAPLTPTADNHVLRPVFGNFTANPSICSGTALDSGCPDSSDDNWLGSMSGLWCGRTHCFTHWISTNASYPHQLWRIDVTGNDDGFIDGYMNITQTLTIGIGGLWGFDTATGGIGGVSVFRTERNVGGDASRMDLVVTGGSLPQLGNSLRFTDIIPTAGTPNLNGNIYGCRDCEGEEAKTRVIIMPNTVFGVKIFNINLGTELCNDATLINSEPSHGVITYDSVRGMFIVTDSDQSPILRELWSVDVDTCAETLLEDITATVDIEIKQLLADTEHDTLFISGATTEASSITYRYGLANMTFIDSLPNLGNGQPDQPMALDFDRNRLIHTNSAGTIRIFNLEGFTTGGTSGEPQDACVDTNLDGIADFCFPDTNGDGIPDSTGGLLNIGTPNQNVTSVAGTFGCGLGLSSCENLDIKTNGVGYILMLIMLVFFAGLIMFFAHKTDTPFNEIHIIFWIVLVLGVTGASYQLNFTDGVPFFATIVSIAGFSGIKMAGYFKGG